MQTSHPAIPNPSEIVGIVDLNAPNQQLGTFREKNNTSVSFVI